MAGIRRRAWFSRLQSRGNRLLTPTPDARQNLPCRTDAGDTLLRFSLPSIGKKKITVALMPAKSGPAAASGAGTRLGLINTRPAHPTCTRSHTAFSMATTKQTDVPKGDGQ
jgi:hypothetical protein